jgi:hypothetical protein
MKFFLVEVLVQALLHESQLIQGYAPRRLAGIEQKGSGERKLTYQLPPSRTARRRLSSSDSKGVRLFLNCRSQLLRAEARLHQSVISLSRQAAEDERVEAWTPPPSYKVILDKPHLH